MTMDQSENGQRVDAVVLAGSVNRIPLFPGDKPGRKALVEMRGKPLIDYVLDALHEARTIDRVLVVGAPEVLEHAARWPRVDLVPEGHSLIRNAHRGMLAAHTDRVLFCNPDQPLLRTEMVDHFVTNALPKDAHVVSSWVRWEDIGRYHVEGEHKFASFGDGKYAHGNLFLVRREFPELQEAKQRFDRLYAARKNNLHFAWELGPQLFGRFLVSAVCGHLPSLDETLRVGGEHFGLTLAPVISPYPEIALDIDEPEDFAAAEQHLANDAREAEQQREAQQQREPALVS